MRDKENTWALLMPEMPLCHFSERFVWLGVVSMRNSSSLSWLPCVGERRRSDGVDGVDGVRNRALMDFQRFSSRAAEGVRRSR